MTAHHKRSAYDRDISFRPPDAACFACYDTGIVSNGDGLLNQYIPDYDCNSIGERHGGLDLAIICHCAAAFSQFDQEGKTIRGALRVSDQPAITISDRGNQPIGASINKEHARDLHRRRAELWKQAEQDMTYVRNSMANGEQIEPPAYITAVREKLAAAETLFDFPF
jgi:hypothetical protein